MFKARLQLLTYAEITNLWQQERTTREEWESHARPVTQLKEMIMPEIMELIQLQRLGFLVEGTRFTKYSNRGQVRLVCHIMIHSPISVSNCSVGKPV